MLASKGYKMSVINPYDNSSILACSKAKKETKHNSSLNFAKFKLKII